MDDSILVSYIKRRMNDSFGQDMSRPKLKTVLLQLTSLSGKEIAKMAGVPYGSYRVFRTEDKYKQTIARNISGLAQEVVHYLTGGTLLNTRFVDTPGRRVFSNPFVQEFFIPLRDVVIFREAVLEAILDQSEAYTFPRELTPGDSLLLKESYEKSVLAIVFALRKGDMIYLDGEVRTREGSSRVTTHSEEFSLIYLAKILAKPWTPPKDIMQKTMADFIDAMRVVS